MANDRDDDLLGNGGDFYEQDDTGSEEFQIPDDEHGDVLDDDLELTEDDVADMSNSNDSDLFFGEEAAELEVEYGQNEFEQEFEEAPGEDDRGASSEPDPEGEEGEPEKAKLGWKAWTGLAFVAVVAAGGMAYAVLPDSKPTQNAPRQAQLAPAPSAPTAPVQQAPVQQAPVQQAPVQQAPVQQFQDQQILPEPEVAGSNIMPSPSTPSAADSGMGDSNVVEPPVQRDQAIDREPAYLQSLEAQRAAFGSIALLADQNSKKIVQMGEQFSDYQEGTDGELVSLDRRVTQLENLLKQSRGQELATSNGTKETVDVKEERGNNDSKPATSDLATNVPKTPAEIKVLQQTLKDYGYRPGFIDGILGGQTRWAIKRLQEEHGLPINGWLTGDTMAAIQNPKHHSGSYPKNTGSQIAKKSSPKKPASSRSASDPNPLSWYVRGVTPTKAVVYRQDGMSYAVSVGSEIPGMGQVTDLDTDKLQVVTAKGVISRR